MVEHVIFTPEAERDSTEAHDWYEARSPGLGERFLRAVDACVQSIRRSPDAFTPVHESYRRALVRRFPYAVIYEHEGDTVTIYAVFHTWRKRLS